MYIHPKDFILTAIPVKYQIKGLDCVWLVDFELQVAACCTLAMYERKDWMGCSEVNSTLFIDFLKAQQRKIAKNTVKTLLNEDIRLVPIFTDSPKLTTFYVGFYYENIPYKISSKVYTEGSVIDEFISEFNL